MHRDTVSASELNELVTAGQLTGLDVDSSDSPAPANNDTDSSSPSQDGEPEVTATRPTDTGGAAHSCNGFALTEGVCTGGPGFVR